MRRRNRICLRRCRFDLDLARVRARTRGCCRETLASAPGKKKISPSMQARSEGDRAPRRAIRAGRREYGTGRPPAPGRFQRPGFRWEHPHCSPGSAAARAVRCGESQAFGRICGKSNGLVSWRSSFPEAFLPGQGGKFFIKPHSNCCQEARAGADSCRR